MTVSLLWQFGIDWRMLRMLWERPSIANAVDIWRKLRGIQTLGGDALVLRPRVCLCRNTLGRRVGGQRVSIILVLVGLVSGA
jgi:hypothetical protein